MNYFTLEELLLLHYKVIEEYGGAHGVRDEGRLEAVLSTPGQCVFGKELYPTVYDKAAVYVCNIIGDHLFVDGNKRTAAMVGVMFLARNTHKLTASPKELEDFAVRVAVDCLDVTEIAAWLKANSN